MKILLFTRSMEYGGAQRQFALLGRELKKRGHDVIVTVFYSGGYFEKEIVDNDVKLHDLKKNGRWDIFPFLIRFARHLKNESPDVIYSCLPLPNVLAILFRKQTPSSRIVIGVRASTPEFSAYEPIVRVVARLEAKLSRFSDRVIVNSQAGLRDCLKDGFPKSRLTVIYNGIDTTYFTRSENARRKYRECNAVKPEESLIGVVGRLDPMKDHDTFLMAFHEVSRLKQNLKALIIGRGSQKQWERLEIAADQMDIRDRVLFRGSTEDMPGVYSALDILVLSSSFGEGFPNVVAESMSCETPCIVTDTGDAGLIVDDDRWVIEPENPEALCDALVQLLDLNLSRQYGRRLRERIDKEYSVRRFVEDSERILCSMA